jgi:hypothetical protein
MTAKKRRVTAEELLAELESNADYQERMQGRDAAAARAEADFRRGERPLLEALRQSGVDVDSILELAARYRRIPRHIVELLLHWLPKLENERVQEWVVRTLANVTEPFDGHGLVEAFEKSQNVCFRWAIANTIAEARPTGVSEWLPRAITNRRYGQAREMLIVALARVVPRETAVPLLLSLFDDFPGHVAEALAEVGGPRELEFLQAAMSNTKGWARKAIARAMRRIETRCRREG